MCTGYSLVIDLLVAAELYEVLGMSGEAFDCPLSCALPLSFCCVQESRQLDSNPRCSTFHRVRFPTVGYLPALGSDCCCIHYKILLYTMQDANEGGRLLGRDGGSKRAVVPMKGKELFVVSA